jgi:hypothetical protein
MRYVVALSRLLPAGMLLGGFLLVEPPVVDKKVDTSAPLSKWTHISNFDSQKACDEARAARIAADETSLGAMAEEDNDGGPLVTGNEARMASKCVSDAEVYGSAK